jgi:hypothetical protein
MPFFYDRDLMLVSPAAVLSNAVAFEQYLQSGQTDGAVLPETAALLGIFQELLKVIRT